MAIFTIIIVIISMILKIRYMWSDTGSSSLISVGDIRKYHDPEKKFAVGPETSPTRWTSKDYPVKEESSYSWKNGF